MPGARRGPKRRVAPPTYGMARERAADLGGSIVMPAMKVDEETEIAMFTDPRGGTFGLYGSAH